MDRGFQVLLTAYPRTQETIDYGALELKAFHSGAQVRMNGKFYTLGDPLRHPGDAMATLLAPIGSLSDKTRMLHLRDKVTELSVANLLERPEVTTDQRLREFGFSEKMVRQFFKPFLGGIFLEPNLVTSSRKFEFVFRMFSMGEAALPTLGIQAIPQQLLNRLRPDVVRTATPVREINDDCVVLENGGRVDYSAVVIATAPLEAARLRGRSEDFRNASVTCLYYSADRSPVKGPWLVLNGEGSGPINNLCVPSELHANYAPAGKSLVSVTVLGVSEDEARLEAEVRKQLSEWYGEEVSKWRHLRTYAIPEALIMQEPPALETVKKPVQLSVRTFLCGDYLSITSIEGAISSGLRAADAVIAARG
jgi:hypothetical protein